MESEIELNILKIKNLLFEKYNNNKNRQILVSFNNFEKNLNFDFSKNEFNFIKYEIKERINLKRELIKKNLV